MKKIIENVVGDIHESLDMTGELAGGGGGGDNK